MAKPVILAVDDGSQALAIVDRELRKRYESDYEIICECVPSWALDRLMALQAADRDVAIILAAQQMPGMTGIEFLDRADDLHPRAKRVLLVAMHDYWTDPSVTEPILRAMALRQIDSYLARPTTSPDEGFHRAITEFLADWSRQRQDSPEVAQIIGERWLPRCHDLRDLLERNGIRYGFYEADSPKGQALLQHAEAPNGPFPVVILFGYKVYTNPSNAELADAFTANARPDGQIYDLTIIGAGPAGLSAAVYGASEGLRTMVVERRAMGGQAGMSSMIRNYLGFPQGVSGGDLASRAWNQAWLFGTQFFFMRPAVDLRVEGDHRVLALADGTEIVSRAVVLAMGVAYRRLGIPSLDALTGAGVFYGAAGTEARALQGQPVYVAGAGNSAGQAAIHLAQFAERVTLLVRGRSLTTSMSDYLINEIATHDNIEVRLNTEIMHGHGERRLTDLTLHDTLHHTIETVPAAALFVLIGAQPHTGWLPAAIERDPWGYVLTGQDYLRDGRQPAGWPMSRPPLLLETSMPGVFAAGDVRHRSVKRVASAVGEGAIAIQLIHEYLHPHEH
jgi:thioredoxin reductase (NADPH)